MEDKKYYIATELAKKEIGFKDFVDKDNQDKLKMLQLKVSESLEQIENVTNNSIKTMLTNNPDLNIEELETGIVVSLERKVSEGKINTLEDMKSPEVIKAIQAEVMASDKYYVSSQITAEQVADSVVVGAIAGMTFAEFINKDMTQEEILQVEEQLKNSTEYKQFTIDSMDKLFNSKTQEEKEQAATVVGLRNKGVTSRNFRIQNKGTNADRATIMIISRMAATGEPELIKEAIIEAKLAGFEKLVNQDGTINFGEAHKAMLVAIGEDSKLNARYATIEDFKKEVETANARGSRNVQKEYQSFRENYSTMQTSEDKMTAINAREDRKSRTYSVIKELAGAVKNKESDKVNSLMQEFTTLDSDFAKKVLLSIASKDSTALEVKGQIVEFANERFAAKTDRLIHDTSLNKITAPKVASEGPDWGDR